MLTGLQEKIFLDRYTIKDNNGRNAKVGDTVMVLVDEGTQAHNQDKSAGEVVELRENGAVIKLRNGEVKEFPYTSFSICLETQPEQMWNRLARAIASQEKTEEKRKYWTKKFKQYLSDWQLVPGGRIAAGAGASDELTLFNCYVIPSPKDSRAGIMQTLTEMTEIMSRGGGVGINLSTLRPKRAIVKGVNGTSSGSVSWGALYSFTTGLIEQGGSRRGALMLMINDWHPDLMEFITVKQESGKITNANLSVCVSDAFMKAVEEDLDWELKFPDTAFEKYDEEWDGNLANWEKKGYPVLVYETLKARDIWNTIIESAWKSAEPGVVFMDYYNAVSNSWYFNPIICTNPCGEQGLPAWGVCNLSAINLSKFANEDQTDVDWDRLEDAVKTGVRFLDNVIDATPYHFEENRKNQMKERRIGLGTMGLAELLIKLKIRYGSDESLELLDKLYGFIALKAYEASIDIAAEKGAFPAFERSKHLYNEDAKTETFAGMIYNLLGKEYKEKFDKTGIRNVTILTQAPTGSTGTMVGTSTGIEPYFAFEYVRQSRLGTDKQYVGIAKEWKEKNPGKPLPDYFVSAMDLSAENHIRVQAAIQKWVDSSISKTANVPADFTIDETAKLYEYAYSLGCKGVTIYRDGSRDTQVLNIEKKEEEKDDKKEDVKEQKPTLKKRGYVLDGRTYKYKTPVGTTYVTINVDEDNKPAEIFINVGKAGSTVSAMAEAVGRASSLFLRFGVLPNQDNARLLMEHFSGIGGGEQVTGFGFKKAESIPDAVARAIREFLDEGNLSEYVENVQQTIEINQVDTKNMDICPQCSNFSMINEEGCRHCINCGYSRCS